MTDAFRFPAEWEPQSAVLIAWPHAETDWAQRLGEVEDTYVALVAAITRARINIQTVRGLRRDKENHWQFLLDSKEKIGYIRLTQFTEHTADELRKLAAIQYPNGWHGEGVVVRAVDQTWSFKVINLDYKN